MEGRSTLIWTIAKKEILENLTTYRFAILTGLLIVLMGVSIFVSYGDYELRMDNYNVNHPEPHSSNVMIRPSPLSIFARGVDAHLGRLYYLKYSGIEVQGVEEAVNRLFALFTEPDMLFIVQVMLSLIALLFAFDTITGEKENGTLKLNLVAGINRMGILFGKLIGRTLLVAVPFSFLFLAAAAVVSLLPDVQASVDFWFRIVILLLISDVYIFLFSSLGVVLSSFTHRSRVSIALCLGLWIFLVFVVPQMGMALARTIAEVPPSERVDMQNRLATIRGIYERIHREGDNGTPEGWKQMVGEIRDANSRALDSYRPKLNRQIQLTKGIISFSPAGALMFLATDVAGTGIYEDMRYKDALSAFLQRNFDVVSRITNGEIENFQYDRATLGEVIVRSSLGQTTAIILFGVLSVAVSLMSFHRYDPR